MTAENCDDCLFRKKGDNFIVHLDETKIYAEDSYPCDSCPNPTSKVHIVTVKESIPSDGSKDA